MQSTNGEGSNESSKQGGLSWSTPQQPSNVQKTFVPPAPAKFSAAPTSTGNTGKYVGMVVVGVIAGVLVGWAWGAWKAPATNTTLTGTGSTNGAAQTGTGTSVIDTTGVGLGSNPSLTIQSPQKAGTSVAIEKAIVSQPTWIVVYENKAGKPGNALGAALFFPEGQRGTVELLRATTAGETYLVTKQTDNGDRRFSLKGDPILMEGGEALWVSFVAN